MWFPFQPRAHWKHPAQGCIDYVHKITLAALKSSPKTQFHNSPKCLPYCNIDAQPQSQPQPVCGGVCKQTFTSILADSGLPARLAAGPQSAICNQQSEMGCPLGRGQSTIGNLEPKIGCPLAESGQSATCFGQFGGRRSTFGVSMASVIASCGADCSARHRSIGRRHGGRLRPAQALRRL